MKHSTYRAGKRRLEITCADVTGFLNGIIAEGIEVRKIEYCSELVLRLDVNNDDYEKLTLLLVKYGGSINTLEKKGVFWLLTGIAQRPALVCSIIAVILLFAFLPTRVLFVRVEGNTTIPSNQIIESAYECGIQFGASCRRIRSEKMKNALLEKIPQLQWAGINTSGCTAVISVREKSEPALQNADEKQVCSIVASRDGVIQSCTVFRGNPICQVGQAVKAGQTLVSGYTDCGIYVQATKAEAEVRALTKREIEVISPKPTSIRGEIITKKTEYSIRIGKKLIKLTKDSGILGTTCAKIYLEEYVHLPGGFQLPVALVKSTVYTYETTESTAQIDDNWMYSFADNYLKDHMVAGEIVSAQARIEDIDGGSYLYGQYACVEMIGRVKYEQTILKDGTND